MNYRGRLVLLAGLLPSIGYASENLFLAMSLEELMDIPVDVASRAPLPQRESPGVITIISGEQIRRQGARDLLDVLRLVPGFDFRLISNNVLGLGVRGHTGSDGRVLLLVDGIEINEQRFGTAQLGAGFPLESIERIEIVRGSALAMYGATAELGVIHIVTRKPAEIDGAILTTQQGIASGEHSREQYELLAGKDFESGQWSLSAYTGRALRSTARFSMSGASYDMGEDDYLHPEHVNFGLSLGDLNLRYLRDDTEVDARAAGGVIRPAAWTIQQSQESFSVSYPLKSSSVSITPSLLYQEQSPRETRTDTGVLNSKTELHRTLGKVDLAWAASDAWNISTGAEYLDASYRGEVRTFPLRPLAYEEIKNSAYYAELLHKADWGNLVLGGRLLSHEYAGDLWAERLAYTKLWESWNLKWISSRAERAPSLEDYSAGLQGLSVRENEKMRSNEFELGWRGEPHQQITLNLFDIATDNTLILLNQGTTRTKGLELVYQRSFNQAELSFAYSHYQADNTSTLAALPRRFPDDLVIDDTEHITYAPDKFSASMSYKFTDNISLNPSLLWLSRRWTYTQPLVSTGVGTLVELPSVTLLDLALDWRNAGMSGLDVNLTLHNALDEQHNFYQPFRSSASYLPDMGREWVLGVRYRY